MLKIPEEIILQKRRVFPIEILKTKANGWNVNLHSRTIYSFPFLYKRRGRKGVKECENY